MPIHAAAASAADDDAVRHMGALYGMDRAQMQPNSLYTQTYSTVLFCSVQLGSILCLVGDFQLEIMALS